ncbi:MAG TPA: GntR family transcriptional regulator [Microbacterium sp.]|uniref:GntR family transcriptional regulator n=1 Tax=Microbacterium sp. TaxID=51671 RepID=UPI002B491C92|nr:GntR family transcriptional regulator [Microbacterium sp.]HKT58083.1 GntR family transcriptional regulator [Microbacterium sp.]
MTSPVVDPGSSVPPFEQLRTQLAAQIESGQRAEGAKLPPVRRLAEQLGLAANTVARAYRELEAAGLVVTGGRNGTIVAPGRVRAVDPAASRAADRYLEAMGELGYDADAAVDYLRRKGA